MVAPTQSVQPTRTLTFLFADLRDYSRFVESRGDAAARELIAEFRQLVRAALRRTGGGEVKTEGDNFYLVFESAGKALECAAAILNEAERRTGERADLPLLIGIGIHAGEPLPHEGQFVGSAVNIAARLAQAAGRNEILATDTVRGLVRTSGGHAMAERTGLVLKGIADAPRAYVVGWRTAAEPEGPRRTRVDPPARGEVQPEALDRRLMFSVVVGRDAELAALDALARNAVAGHGRVVLVAGDAGIGKSAFIRRFGEIETSRRLYVGQCNEIDARVSFGPFVEILRALMRDPSALTEEALRVEVTALLALFPDASVMSIEALADADRYRAHAAFARVLAAIASHAPTVIVIEDLHWADEATLELVPYLARKIGVHPLLVVVTYRSDELHRTHPLRHVLAELSRARSADEIRLRPLTRQEIGSAITDALHIGRPPSEDFLEALYSRAEGNPLVVEEILRSLVERGELALRDGAWRRTREVAAIQIPETLRDAVRERYHALDESTREVLRYAAVLGQRVTFELLRALTGADERTLVKSLRAAIDAQLLIEEPGPEDEETYAFRHALTRESVLGELLHRERRLLHRAVAEAIERVPGTDPSARAEALAYHYDEARDTQKALLYHDEAAREAQRALAYSRARGHLERALELAADDDPRLPSLHRRLAQAAIDVADYPGAARAAEAAYQGFVARGDALAAAEAAAFTARVDWNLGAGDQAETMGLEAVHLAEPFGETRELGFAIATVARNAMVNVRTAEARSWSERGLALARSLDDKPLIADVLATLGSVLPQMGKPDEGIALLREAIALGVRAGAHAPVGRAYFNLWVWLWISAGTAKASTVYGEALAWAETVGLQAATNMPFISGLLAFASPDWPELARVARVTDARNIFDANVQLLQATARLATDGPDAARALLEAPTRTIRVSSGWLHGHGNARLAKLHWLAGEYDDVLARGADTFGQSAVAQVAFVAATALWAARELGDRTSAERYLQNQFVVLGPITVGAQAVTSAYQLEERGELLAAANAYAQSAVSFAAAADPVQVTAARLMASAVLLKVGDQQGAWHQYRQARAFWEAAGATWYLARLDAWSAARGLRGA